MQDNTLESEIRQIIAEGKEGNVFIEDEEGIWFGGVNKTNTGRILAAQQTN
jgi:filamentous hemagglutinin family protein